MNEIECVVVGAGILGLAVARAVARAGFEVLVLEAAYFIGSETSSRNSEVIHAGIYYPPGSLKARFCVEGRDRLYKHLEARGIPFRRCGKLIVATEVGGQDHLARIQTGAAACGVTDLQLLSRAQALALEPELRVQEALLSPSTGIVDSHALMLSYQAEAEASGTQVVLGTEVLSGEIRGNGRIRLRTASTSGGDAFEVTTSILINAAGLAAPSLAGRINGFPLPHVPPSYLAKGSYFAARGKCPFSRLIYPLPVEGGLGIHLTFDLAGQMRFGPDVEWVQKIDYAVDARRSDGFYDEIRRYWPALPDDGLTAAYSGIRPKLSGPGQPNADFRIEGPETHGVSSVVNLFGMESPGITASLAVADHVLGLIKG